MIDFTVLDFDDIFYGIPDAEPGNQQGGAAAYTQNHHKKPLLIAEYVSRRNFMQEFQFAPDERYPFNENTLSGGRRFRTYELGRNLGKLMVTRIYRRSDGTYYRGQEG